MTARFRPSGETEYAVKNWITNSGINGSRITHSENKGWYAFFATAAEAERLLNAEFHEYEDTVTGGVMPACDEYQVPDAIRHHVDYITPGIKLQAPVESHGSRKQNAERLTKKRNLHGVLQKTLDLNVDPESLATCDVAITPACVAALYKIPRANGTAVKGNSLGIFESELQFYTQEDLDLFFHNYTR